MSVQGPQDHLITLGKQRVAKLQQKVTKHKENLALAERETSDSCDLALKTELMNDEQEYLCLLNEEIVKVEAFIRDLENGKGLYCPCCGNEVSIERMEIVLTNLCTGCTDKKKH